MKICRYNDNRLGLVKADQVFDVTSVLATLPAHRYPLPTVDPLIANLKTLMPAIEAAAQTVQPVPLSSVTLLSPIANPGKIVAAPVNYKAHLAESQADTQINFNTKVVEIQTIGLFLKATSSMIGAGESVKIRHPERRNDHEIELVVIIGKTADRVSEVDALDYVAGYCIGLDMTIRGPEERSMRKSLDSFTVFGPCFVTADELNDPSQLNMVLTVNDEPRQNANTRDLIIGVRQLISWASSFYTLHPGDVIMTGTPEGVAPVQPGDVIHARIDQIGEMHVHVSALAPKH